MADGERRERVTWFPIAWNGLSEACANFPETGRLVCVQGRVQTRQYEDKEGTHQVMQVVAEKVTFLGCVED